MRIREISSKSILSSSKIFDYTINPYIGCQYGCSYCYARFMKRFTGHKEPWGDFVSVKINAHDLLSREIKRKQKGTVWVSGVCDPYQPLEERYELTRRCIDILVQEDWPVIIQTRSPLVQRDMDIFRNSKRVEVGLSITTANDQIRQVFEPRAPSIHERLETVESLDENGIKTFVMIAPILPEADNLMRKLCGKVDYVILDRMNYGYADRIYHIHGWTDKNTDEYFNRVKRRIEYDCAELGIDCRSA